ncbi:MAG: DNA polymerase [Candidatus Paceibacterota bacterium]|jgi:DNA polymerase-1
MKKETKTLLLLDSHAILHRAYHALPDFRSENGEPTGALYGFVAFVLKAIKDLKPDYVAACFDLPGPTFRHEEYKEYKATRAKTEDDLISQLKVARGVAEALGIPVYEHPGFEADDMLGTIVKKVAEERPLSGGLTSACKIIIASGDMDTLQLVKDDDVVVYTLKKGLNDTVIYNEKAVEERFGFKPKLLPDYKGLRGDASDNIIGVKGIGEKTAEELIQKFGTIENIMKKAKTHHDELLEAGIKERIIGLLKTNEDEALFSKMLATIRDDAPIDFKLPEKTWREGVDIEKVEAMCKQYSFRTLAGRIREAVAGTGDRVNSPTPNSQLPTPPNFKKLQIMAWLVDSSATDPEIEKVLEVAGVSDVGEVEAVLMKKIHEAKLEKVLNDIELPLVPIIDAAEKCGILVSKKKLADLSEEYHIHTARLEKQIHDLAGKEFNISSPKQMGEVLFDTLKLEVKGLKKTAGGARSTKESELDKLKDLHPIINKILEYREYKKLLSTYIDAIPKLLDKEGRLHTTLVQAGTTTGRMSSNNPNLQNIPIKTELGRAIREAFIAPKGTELLALDYSQIELRVAAALSGDEKLLKIFKEGGDVHASVASLVFGVPPDKVDHEMRRKAKVINFGIIYGMGVNALKTNLGTTREEAQQFHDAYFEQFKQLGEYLDNILAETKHTKYTTTLYGRRRYFKNINSRMPQLRAMEERMAGNAPLQGTAADIIKLAMIKAEHELKKAHLHDDAKLLLQVHDELIYEVKKEKVEEVAKVIKQAMETASDIKCPIIANVSKGPSWGEMKKLNI